MKKSFLHLRCKHVQKVGGGGQLPPLPPLLLHHCLILTSGLERSPVSVLLFSVRYCDQALKWALMKDSENSRHNQFIKSIKIIMQLAKLTEVTSATRLSKEDETLLARSRAHQHTTQRSQNSRDHQTGRVG